MKRRCGLLFLLALWAGTSGCATSARRSDGTPIFGSSAWNQAPAPPQAVMASSGSGPGVATGTASKSEGLARYFPGLKRVATEPPKVAARHRPTWFGLRPNKGAGTQTYMTDARAGLNQGVPEPTALPVALQVPTDRAVTPANAEAVQPDPPARSSANDAGSSPPPGRDSPSSDIPDFGGKPSAPGEDEVNPLPPAAEPGPPAAAVERTPQLPMVDPRDRPSVDPTNPTAGPPSDEKAVQAANQPADPLEPTSGSAQPTTQVAKPIEIQAPPKPVLASPQSAPPKPSSQVTPTSQVKPSPQSETTHAWKRPCLRRLIRKVCKLGEYANPPTAAPH